MSEYDYSDMFAALFKKSDLPSKDLSQNWMQVNLETFYSSGVSGKFCLFHDSETVDTQWKLVSEAVLAGKLGPCTKVSTKTGKRNFPTHVICVYTKDYNNSEDINRIREALRELGYTDPLPYKADQDTKNGIDRYIFTL